MGSVGSDLYDPFSHLSPAYVSGVNQLVSRHSVDTAVSFLFLPPPPPQQDSRHHPTYLSLLTQLTEGLRPTVLVQGVSAVTTTNL